MVGEGGGLGHEGEDIEVLEVDVPTALRWMEDGTICDGRSVLALQLALSKGKILSPSGLPVDHQ